MLQRSEYGEGHLERMCCYCGEWADTVDHVPSKVFLDEPYPENLPVVPCCRKCNEEFYRQFHTPIFSGLLPEVGSRALMALVENGSAGSLWFPVQPGQYEYCVAPDNSEVRIIIQDYFGVRGQIND